MTAAGPAGHGGPAGRAWLPPLVGAAVGVPLMVAGARGLLVDSDLTNPPRAAAWLVGAAAAHDAVWLPLVLLVAAGVARLAPAVARGPVAAALGLTAVLVAVAWPFAAGFGEDPRNPSVLVRDEAAGTAAYVAAVWVVAGLVVARRARAGRAPKHVAGPGVLQHPEPDDGACPP